jgi:hypothetical protein
MTHIQGGGWLRNEPLRTFKDQLAESDEKIDSLDTLTVDSLDFNSKRITRHNRVLSDDEAPTEVVIITSRCSISSYQATNQSPKRNKHSSGSFSSPLKMSKNSAYCNKTSPSGVMDFPTSPSSSNNPVKRIASDPSQFGILLQSPAPKPHRRTVSSSSSRPSRQQSLPALRTSFHAPAPPKTPRTTRQRSSLPGPKDFNDSNDSSSQTATSVSQAATSLSTLSSSKRGHQRACSNMCSTEVKQLRSPRVTSTVTPRSRRKSLRTKSSDDIFANNAVFQGLGDFITQTEGTLAHKESHHFDNDELEPTLEFVEKDIVQKRRPPTRRRSSVKVSPRHPVQSPQQPASRHSTLTKANSSTNLANIDVERSPLRRNILRGAPQQQQRNSMTSVIKAVSAAEKRRHSHQQVNQLLQQQQEQDLFALDKDHELDLFADDKNHQQDLFAQEIQQQDLFASFTQDRQEDIFGNDLVALDAFQDSFTDLVQSRF